MKQINLLPLVLAMFLVVGGEYEVTHTSGRTSFCKIIEITQDGDYIINRPTKIVGWNAGKIPIVVWKKENILLSSIDVGEARVLRLPRTKKAIVNE